MPRVRAIAAENKSNSTYTRFLTGFKAYTQILAVSLNPAYHAHSIDIFDIAQLVIWVSFPFWFHEMLDVKASFIKDL